MIGVLLLGAGSGTSKDCPDKFQKDVVCRKKPYGAGPCDVDDVCECCRSLRATAMLLC